MKLLSLLFTLTLFAALSFKPATPAYIPLKNDTLHYPQETHFKNVQQLTFGGDNAEAYWSYDGKSIVFQRTSLKDGVPCDQIFVGKVPENGEPFTYKMISSGKGRTTCAFFTEDNKHVI